MNIVTPAAPRLKQCSRRLSSAAFSLAEVTIASMMMGLLVFGVLSLVNTVSRASDRNSTDTQMAGDSRLAMDEMLYHLRGAHTLLPGATIGGRAITAGVTPSGGFALVFNAPGFDNSDPNDPRLLTGVYDTVAFRWEPDDPAHPEAGGKLYESILPGAGSRRPARADKVLAKNVRSFVATYRAGEEFQAEGGTSATSPFASNFTLPVAPTATPICYINGVQTACIWQEGTNTVGLSNLHRRDDVQVFYIVDRRVVAPSTLGRVSQVDIALTMAVRDARNIDRIQALQGGARLRNQRL